MDELEAHRRLIQGLDLVARVREGLEAASPAGYQELNTLDYPIMMMYARCRSLFEGIDVLIRDNLAEEGIILARSLFEESLRLMHLAKEGERRWEYTVGWILQSIEYKRSLISDTSSEAARVKSSEWQAQLDEEERQVRSAMKRLGVTGEKRFTSPQNLATMLGRVDDLWPYEVGHRMVHGSQVALAYRAIKTQLDNSEEGHMLVIRSDKPLPKLLAIVFGTESMLHAHESVSSIIEFISELEGSQEFFAEIETLHEEPLNRSGT